jgi:tRNA pseudouridine65 synthase
MIEILYEDDQLVAINKPTDILVHLTRLSEDRVSITQLLRAQMGTDALYPTHRLVCPHPTQDTPVSVVVPLGAAFETL